MWPNSSNNWLGDDSGDERLEEENPEHIAAQGVDEEDIVFDYDIENDAHENDIPARQEYPHGRNEFEYGAAQLVDEDDIDLDEDDDIDLDDEIDDDAHENDIPARQEHHHGRNEHEYDAEYDMYYGDGDGPAAWHEARRARRARETRRGYIQGNSMTGFTEVAPSNDTPGLSGYWSIFGNGERSGVANTASSQQQDLDQVLDPRLRGGPGGTYSTNNAPDPDPLHGRSIFGNGEHSGVANTVSYQQQDLDQVFDPRLRGGPGGTYSISDAPDLQHRWSIFGNGERSGVDNAGLSQPQDLDQVLDPRLRNDPNGIYPISAVPDLRSGSSIFGNGYPAAQNGPRDAAGMALYPRREPAMALYPRRQPTNPGPVRHPDSILDDTYMRDQHRVPRPVPDQSQFQTAEQARRARRLAGPHRSLAARARTRTRYPADVSSHPFNYPAFRNAPSAVYYNVSGSNEPKKPSEEDDDDDTSEEGDGDFVDTDSDSSTDGANSTVAPAPPFELRDYMIAREYPESPSPPSYTPAGTPSYTPVGTPPLDPLATLPAPAWLNMSAEEAAAWSYPEVDNDENGHDGSAAEAWLHLSATADSDSLARAEERVQAHEAAEMAQAMAIAAAAAAAPELLHPHQQNAMWELERVLGLTEGEIKEGVALGVDRFEVENPLQAHPEAHVLGEALDIVRGPRLRAELRNTFRVEYRIIFGHYPAEGVTSRQAWQRLTAGWPDEVRYPNLHRLISRILNGGCDSSWYGSY
ncbi:hypothetical protein UCREL1_9430 [Eutypa lata UCREL1]|uniref:Uncharacterized protein n=1 Tax=Eutypa lata (strain UCR-EL1) TaxID=1287681 RepID=M7T1F2_EUTLA|nr:hypothetical protein UCREL1_9430 [Eutypa lata UCREL1]